jgi:nitroimidazol reductase NimA-like FMN-containing flavoprotein (pyridoxamine 5'-phosphate oxidase superfamily)
MSTMTDAVDGEASDPVMHVIPAEKCYRLLGTQEIGRVGLNAEHYPLIFPVNYALDGTTLVIRTHAGTILGAAEHANVTFQVDDIDRRTRSGWSVLVRGQAEEVGEEHRSEIVARTHAAGVEPWAPGEKGHWLRIIAHEIAGRRIVPGHLPGLDPRAYL